MSNFSKVEGWSLIFQGNDDMSWREVDKHVTKKKKFGAKLLLFIQVIHFWSRVSLFFVFFSFPSVLLVFKLLYYPWSCKIAYLVVPLYHSFLWEKKNITIGKLEQKILSFEVRMGVVKILCFWRYVGGCRSWQSTGFAKIIPKTCFRGKGEPLTAHSWSWLTKRAVFQNFSFHFHLCYPFAL